MEVLLNEWLRVDRADEEWTGGCRLGDQIRQGGGRIGVGLSFGSRW